MNRVTATVTLVDRRPPPNFSEGSNAWDVELRYRRRRMTVPFYTGPLAGEPNGDEVLECLFSDASLLDEFSDHYEMAAGLGMTPSRQTERIWEQIGHQTKKLHRLLGADYETVEERVRERY